MAYLIREADLVTPAWADGITVEHKRMTDGAYAHLGYIDILYAIGNSRREAIAWRVCNARAEHYSRSSWSIEMVAAIASLAQ